MNKNILQILFGNGGTCSSNTLKPSWWQYDERTSKDLELSYKNNEKTCELLIAGFLYIIDLENMLQIRRNDPSRRRRIKRDHATVAKKGVAGLHSSKQNVPSSDNNLVESSPTPEQFTSVHETDPDVNNEESSEETENVADNELNDALQSLNDLHISNDE